MTESNKAKVLAIIRESECIGCTKCIDACPVDAILGSAKHMHTVIAAECIGCKLCIPACPIDCIDLIPLPETTPRIPTEHVKARYQARQVRLKTQNLAMSNIATADEVTKKDYLAKALKRSKGVKCHPNVKKMPS